MTALNRTTAVPSNSSSDLTGVVGGALGQPSSDDGQAAQARMEQRWAQTLDEYYAQLNLEMPYNLAWNDHQRVGQERALYIRQGKWVNPLTFLFVDDWSSLESVESVSQKAKENRVRAALPSIKIRENRRGFSLMVNPASLDLSLSKNITPVYSRSGWIISYNSQPHPTLSASGQTPGFYVQDSLGMGGITRTRRSWSGAWNNLMDLVNLFRNNATKRYDGNQSRIHHVGTVHIDFEGWNYEGSFRNLSIREVAGQPFMLEYSFDFDVRDMWFSSSLSARAGGNQYIRWPNSPFGGQPPMSCASEEYERFREAAGPATSFPLFDAEGESAITRNRRALQLDDVIPRTQGEFDTWPRPVVSLEDVSS